MNTITREDLQQKLANKEPVSVVDIREAGDYEDWHIAGSINIPVYNEILRGSAAGLKDRAGQIPGDRTVVTVCKAGVTSQFAAQVLESMGYDAASLDGGIREWSLAWNKVEVPLDVDGGQLFQVRRVGKGCLSYLLSYDGKAVIVDPSLASGDYEGLLRDEGLQLEAVLETHVHADHVSRGRILAEDLGADYRLPVNDRVNYSYHAVKDGETLHFGPFEVQAIHTPGHTGESMSYLVNEQLLLSGDTLFVDAVGRPDLEEGDAGAKKGAETLYDSLHQRILPLDDSILVAPAHASTMIGFDDDPIAATLGEIKREVKVLDLPRQQFVPRIVESLTAKPNSFEQVIAINEGKDQLYEPFVLDLEAGPNRCAAGGE